MEVTLSKGERVLDTHKTFRDNELTDGMEITATVMRDEPPPLRSDSSGEDMPPRHNSDLSDENSNSDSSESGDDINLFALIANSHALPRDLSRFVQALEF